MALDLSTFPIGSRVNFLAGPTRLPINNAEVTGHDNGFVVTKDSVGRERKVRPKALTLA